MSPMRARFCAFPGFAARRCSSTLTAAPVDAGSKYASERKMEEAVCPSSASAGYFSASALLERLYFGFEFSRSREKFEEAVAQIRLFEPVLPQNRFPGSFVVGFDSHVSRKKIAHKNGIVGESPIRIQVQAEIHRDRATDKRLKIVFQLTTLENTDGVLRQLLELGCLSLPQVKSRQLVIPGTVREAGHRTPVNVLLLHTEAVLVQKNRQPLV